MVKITIELEEKYHNSLKELSKKNKRSMRNELLILIEKILETEVKHTNMRSLGKNEEDKYFMKPIAGMKIPTLFMNKEELK